MSARHTFLRLSAAAAAVLAGSWSVPAQTTSAGARTLSVSVSERLEATDNPDFVAEPSGGRVLSFTGLSAAYETNTRLDQLSFTLDAALRAALTDGDVETSVDSPRFGFAYQRLGANSTFSATGQLRRDRIDYLRPLEEFLLPDGTIDLPEDLEDLQGAGTRGERQLALAYQTGLEGPLGIGLDTSVTEVDYGGASNADLQGYRTTRLGAQIALRPRGPISIGVDLGWTRYDQDGVDATETTSIGVSGTLNGPGAGYTFALSRTDAPQDDRYDLSFGRAFETRTLDLEVSLGASFVPDGGTALTGTLGYAREGANSAFSLDAERQARFENGEGQSLVTSLSASYSRPLTEQISLSLSSNFVRNESFGADDGTDIATVGATVGYALSRDWSVDLGYRYNYRDEPGDATVDENVLYLGLGRTFTFRR